LTDEPAVTPENIRRLAGATIAVLERHGSEMMAEAESGRLISGRTARVGGLFLVERDKTRADFRRVDAYLIASEDPPSFDERFRIYSLQTTHNAEPPDWRIDPHLPPDAWFAAALCMLLAVLDSSPA
jgi:hypothetical protein